MYFSSEALRIVGGSIMDDEASAEFEWSEGEPDERKCRAQEVEVEQPAEGSSAEP